MKVDNVDLVVVGFLSFLCKDREEKFEDKLYNTTKRSETEFGFPAKKNVDKEVSHGMG